MLNIILWFGYFNIHMLQSQPFEHRNAELLSATTYELLQFNIESLESESILEFDAFNQHYAINLTLNEDAIAADIKHSNINPSQHTSDPYFTSLNRSCHYFGDLLNTNEASIITISICNKRGIRGQITAFNETLIIKPCAHFFDTNHDIHYKPTDTHLIYKLSDYDYQKNNQLYADSHDISWINNTKSSNSKSTKRRLAQYNNGNNIVELYILSDPARTHYYINNNEETNEQDWYEQMVADLMDMVSWVSLEFMKQDWGPLVGTIKVKLVELEVVYDYTGIYEVLEPTCFFSETPDDYIDCSICWINSTVRSNNMCRQSGPLAPFRTFISRNKPLNNNKYADFDVPIIITNIWMLKRSGASGGTICSTSKCTCSAAGIVPESTIAHEIGHCFDINHDWVSGCEPVNQQLIMNYGGGTRSGFSNCSVAELQETFAESTDGMECLAERVKDLNIINSGDKCRGDECVQIGSLSKDLNGKSYNKRWRSAGCDDNNDHYYQVHGINGSYLCYNKENERWIITTTLCNYSDRVAFCAANTETIHECTNAWTIKHSEDEWAKDESVLISGCSMNDTLELDHNGQCLHDLGNRICVHNNNGLWNHGNAEFIVLEGVCSFGEAVYQYTIYNTTDIIVDDVGDEYRSVIEVYYLRYIEYPGQILQGNGTINITNGQWIITLDDMTGMEEAICWKKDIRECVANTWFLQNIIEDDSVLRDVIDPFMTINMDQCGDNGKSDQSSDIGVMIGQMFFVLVPGIVWIVMLFSTMFRWCKSKVQTTEKTPKETDVSAGFDYVLFKDTTISGVHGKTNIDHDKVAKCADCGLLKKGKMYDELFYCLDCWKYYEDDGTLTTKD